MLRKYLILVIAAFLTTSLLVLATVLPPQIYFTDNIGVVGTTLAPSAMEQQLLDRLNGAANTIDAAIYTLNRYSIRDALIAAHNRGVTVRVVADDDAYNNPSYQVHFQALETAGIPLVLDNRSSLMHNKFIIIDGAILWTGSTNLTHTGFTYNHNNSIVFTSTQIADIYEIEFDEMFVSGLFGTAKTDNTTHTLTYAGSPLEIYFSPSDGAIDEVISEINTADTSVHFAIFYLTNDQVRDALIAAHNRGVIITGIFDLLGASNQFSDDEALCNAGIQIKVEDFPSKMHHKFMIIDADGLDPVIITGSMNWSAAGGDANDENTIIFHDLSTTQTYLAEYQTLFDALGPETLCTGEYTVFLPLLLKSGPPTSGDNDIKIISILYDPPDPQPAVNEYVEIRNTSSGSIDMTNWTLEDDATNPHVFTFPSFILDAQATVRVWTNIGTNDASNLYWGRGSAIWNNSGDVARLKNTGSQLIDECLYSGGGQTAICN